MYYHWLEESRRLRQSDHQEMLFAAGAALYLATTLRPEDFLPGVADDLRARAWAELGNAYRITESFGDAEDCFKEALLDLRRGSGQAEPSSENLGRQLCLWRRWFVDPWRPRVEVGRTGCQST